MHKWKPLLVSAGLVLTCLASSALSAQAQEVARGYVRLGPNGLAWLELATVNGTWAVQLTDGCPISPPADVTVLGSLDAPGAQVQTLDGLVACTLATVQPMGTTGCAEDPRTGLCDVRFDS